MSTRRPASRLDVCAFLAGLYDAAGQPTGHERYIAEMLDIVLVQVRA